MSPVNARQTTVTTKAQFLLPFATTYLHKPEYSHTPPPQQEKTGC